MSIQPQQQTHRSDIMCLSCFVITPCACVREHKLATGMMSKSVMSCWQAFYEHLYFLEGENTEDLRVEERSETGVRSILDCDQSKSIWKVNKAGVNEASQGDSCVQNIPVQGMPKKQVSLGLRTCTGRGLKKKWNTIGKGSYLGKCGRL